MPYDLNMTATHIAILVSLMLSAVAAPSTVRGRRGPMVAMTKGGAQPSQLRPLTRHHRAGWFRPCGFHGDI